MSEERKFQVELAQEKDFAFKIDFGLEGVDDLVMDEPEPVGGGSGPNASRVLAAAIGNCLCASLLFCLRKSRAEVSGMRATVNGAWVRNEEGRWRIREVDVKIAPGVAEGYSRELGRCAEIFEQFCVVSQSLRDGIKLNVKVNR
ncbi:MAG: OsmC family protein [Candidatus Bathyarchaeia archaeon]